MLIMDKGNLIKCVERVIEDYFNSTHVAIGRDEYTINDFLYSFDSEYNQSVLAERLASHIIEDFLDRMSYSFVPNFNGKTSCKECGSIKGIWMPKQVGPIIYEEELKGKHIIVPF